MLQNKNNHHYWSYIKRKCNKSNLLIISFFIFVSIAVIIGVSLGTKRWWFDVISIISIFYITLPILAMIFTMGGKGIFRKGFDLFKFKEIKNINKNKFTPSEQKQLKVLDLQEEETKIPKDNSDLIFISIILIIYGMLLLLISMPSLILFSIK